MPCHVLVVDDDAEIRETVLAVLRDEGCAVAAAADGREALEQIAASPPRVLLLDMRMPVLDGWGVAAELRARGIVVPTVVMTAATDARAWAAEIGAQAYLAKPFDLDRLVDTVTRFAPCPPPAAG